MATLREPDRTGRSAALAAIAGLAGSSAVMAVAAVAHTVSPRVPFPPLAMAQTLVHATPGGVATSFIDLVGHWALRLAVIGTVLAFAAAGPLLGLLIPPLASRLGWGRYPAAGVAFLPLWAAIVVLSPTSTDTVGRGLLALAMLPALAGAAWAAGRTYGRLVPAPRIGAEPAASNRSPQAGVGRRVVLRALWFGAAGALLGVSNLGRILRPRPNPGRLMIHLPDVAPAVRPSSGPSDAAFDRIVDLTPEVTSNADFYVVDEEIVDPDIDPATWRLAIGGLVRTPVSFGYRELLRFPAVERYQTLECISNKVGGDLISTAKWVGIPLPLLLERAGVDPKAVEVVFRAAAGYSDSLSIDQAMDESTLVAVGMNDHVLPREHGFPARLLSVGTYGMKNPKWLERIEVVGRPYTGYWEQRGWSKRAVVKTESRIDVPRTGQGLPGPATVAGIAFAGDRGISRVEISRDGGSTWAAAELKRPLSPYAWRLWRYRLSSHPSPRTERIVVRAHDGKGVPQAATVAQPHPDGASGYDGITVSG